MASGANALEGTSGAASREARPLDSAARAAASVRAWLDSRAMRSRVSFPLLWLFDSPPLAPALLWLSTLLLLRLLAALR